MLEPTKLAELLAVLRDHGVTEYADGALTLKLAAKPLTVHVAPVERVTKTAAQMAEENFAALEKAALGVIEMGAAARI